MNVRNQIAGISAATLIMGAGFVLAGAAPAEAASGCRAAPYSFKFQGYGALYFPEDPAGEWVATETPVLKTTSQCRDINVKNVGSQKTVRACVMFGTTTNKCNYTTDIPVGQWRNVATDVKDNTKFRMRLGVVLGGKTFDGNGANGVADF